MKSKAFALLASAAMVAAIGAGCSKGDQSSSSTTTTTTSSATSAPEVMSSATPATSATTAASSTTSVAGTTAQGDAARGKTIFTNNCSNCHGATGHEGGVGPSLTNEKSRKNNDATIAWIKNPQPPMPKLYPSPLSEKDVDDVAAYVQSL